MYLPGDDRQRLWGSRWLETVPLKEPTPAQDTAHPLPDGLCVQGDVPILLFLSLELRSIDRTVRTPLALVPH